MKKAEVQQVFTYIIVLLVVGAVLLLGVRSIINIFNKACDVDEAAFKQDIERIIRDSSRIGNLRYETLSVPCEYDKLCFITSTNPECADIDVDEHPLIRAECDLNTGNNIFLIKGQETTPLFSIENIKINALQKTIDISNLSGGVYILRVQTEKGFEMKKIIKQ